MLTFAWLGPLLKFGLKTPLEAFHLSHVDIVRAATYRDVEFRTRPTLSNLLKDILGLIVSRTIGALALNILLASSRLCQPLIIQSLVKFLQGNHSVSTGRWLVVAVFFE